MSALVPSIASWPVCKTGVVQFAGILSAGELKPVVEKVGFDPARTLPMVEATVQFAQSQLALTGRNLFCADWAGHRLILCQETEPMVLLGGPDLNFNDVLKNLERAKQPSAPDALPVDVPIEWDTNLDRHFWNFLQIIERTTASRTLLLGFGQESYKLGITEGAIHEPGKLKTVDLIVKKFRTTARARRKITYFAGARRRKKTIKQPLLPLQLANTFAISINSDVSSNSAAWILDSAGWPVQFPESASFDDYRRALTMRFASAEWLKSVLHADRASFFTLDTSDQSGTRVQIDKDGCRIETEARL